MALIKIFILWFCVTAAWAEEKPKAPAPEGITPNMVWLPEATVLRYEGKGVATLTDGAREYVVTFIPENANLAVGEISPAIIVRGPVMQEHFGGRRLYRWFSAGQINDRLIEEWNANRDAFLVYPLR